MAYNPDNRRARKEQPLGDVIEKLMKAYRLDDKMKEYDLNDCLLYTSSAADEG